MIGSYREGETMLHPKKGVAALAAVALALLAGACNKGPAEASLNAAEQALAAATPEIQRYAPGELGPLTSAVQAARSDLEKGNYTAALKAARALPAQIEAALAAAAVQKDRLVAAWNEVSGGLGGEIQAITGRLSGLADAKALPRGMTQDTLAAAQADLESVTHAWSEAGAAFQGGDVPKALETARDVKARVDALAGTLALTAAPSPPAAAR
jgi:hypothetical protein